jgi:hypothetical protein
MSKEKPTYIEKRGPGEYEVLKQGVERASAILPTQSAAIKRARDCRPTISHISRGSKIQVRANLINSANSHDSDER